MRIGFCLMDLDRDVEALAPFLRAKAEIALNTARLREGHPAAAGAGTGVGTSRRTATPSVK